MQDESPRPSEGVGRSLTGSGPERNPSNSSHHNSSAPAHRSLMQPEPPGLVLLLTRSFLLLSQLFCLPTPESSLLLSSHGEWVQSARFTQHLIMCFAVSQLLFPTWQWVLTLILFNLSSICHHLLVGKDHITRFRRL